jgi:hypothetical protein
MTLAPGEEWRTVAREASGPSALLGSFVLPLSCIPAACWALNRLLFAGDGARDGAGPAPAASQVLYGGLMVFGSTVLSVALLAVSLFALAPLFDRPRDWPRTFRVAAYSGAPVFLGSALLVLPDLAYLLLPAAFQSAYLMYGGVQTVLGVREDRAAEYVALGAMLMIISSTLLGGLGGALGLP